MTTEGNNNQLTIIGTVKTDISLHHEIYGEKFYFFLMEVARKSGERDEVEVNISERLLLDKTLEIGQKVKIIGEFRSYNSYNPDKRLLLFAFVKDIELCDEEEPDYNEVNLIGYTCKKVIYRTTPFGREIADILLAVNRNYNKSDYIPCIVWGRNARYVAQLPVGSKLALSGRLQSRRYRKQLEDGDVERTAYELSAGRLEVLEKAQPKEEEAE